ncbi:KilA-N domain-containing protein [Halomonas sp.]|uniref:KilA-N domain-containing protein n=1 Tax=Halomonas sp. TaxID=1486246 RepID=UPI003D0E0D9E
MSNVIPLKYQGQPVSFNTDGWINATEVAKRFGKRPVKWLELPSTKSYMAALARALGITDVRKSDFGLVTTRRGGPRQGTWLHPKLAVAFARWLDDDFAVWCDLRIDALLRATPSDLQRLQEAEQRERQSHEKGSLHGKGLAQRRWEKHRLQYEVAYWRERTQLCLALDH